MFLNSLLFYIIFIVSALRVDVLLGNEQRNDDLLDPDLRPVTFKNPANRFQNKNTKIRFGGEKVKEFDKHEAPEKVKDKQKQKIRNPFKRNHNGQRYYGSRINDFARQFTMSGKIWRHVWIKCKYVQCYSQNNFAPLYGNYLNEMNLYRKAHGVKQLQFDHRLGKKAEVYAKRNAQAGYLLVGQNFTNGEISTVASLSTVPLVVHRWYQEQSKHNYKTLAPLLKSVHFSTMIWKSSSRVGIGFYRLGNDLYITFLFWPEGNQKFQFKQNVFKPNYKLCNSRNFFKM